MALKEAKVKAELLLRRNQATHQYVSKEMRPKIFKMLKSGEFSPEYFDPSWMSSGYIVRGIDNSFKENAPDYLADYYYKDASTNSRSDVNVADEVEAAFIRKLNDDPELDVVSDIRIIDGKQFYITMKRGEVLKERCLLCHSTPDRAPSQLVDYYGSDRGFDKKAGEVVSALSVRIPMNAAVKNANDLSTKLIAFFLPTLGLLFIMQILISRHFNNINNSLSNEIKERQEAEDEINRINLMLEITGEMSKVGGWELYAQSFEAYFTSETYRIHDLPMGQLPPLEKGFEYYDPLDRPIIENAVQRAFEFAEPYDLELRFISEKGIKKWVHTKCLPITDNGKVIKLTGTIQDITERKNNEIALANSLRDKDLLLKEVHHRVKNNMAVISSLLALQESRTDNKESIDILRDFQNRIHTMTLVHENLFSSGDIGDINLENYISSLTRNILSTFSDSVNVIDCKLEVEQMVLDIDRLIPLGLILNEIITNTVKHAFRDIENPSLKISVQNNEKHFTLNIQDNGTGIPEGIDILKSKSLGGKIIKSLVRQLHGDIQINSGKDGTSFSITCPI